MLTNSGLKINSIIRKSCKILRKKLVRLRTNKTASENTNNHACYSAVKLTRTKDFLRRQLGYHSVRIDLLQKLMEGYKIIVSPFHGAVIFLCKDDADKSFDLTVSIFDFVSIGRKLRKNT